MGRNTVNRCSIGDLGLSVTIGAGDDGTEITGLCVDSRKTKPGDLFAALPGTKIHGGEFIQYALRMDAAAVLTDAEGLDIARRQVGELKVPFIVVADPRRALALAAARFYGKQPATMVAVTGTNGKTSVTTFLRQIWEALGKSAVNIGTAGVHGAVSAPLDATTPEPITLHALLRDLAEQGVTHAAMEASSHGLDQRRLDGVYLTAAGFTNFTQDHLDYHASFEEYFAAKAGLFDRVLPPEGTAVLNVDDPKSPDLIAIAERRGQVVITTGSGEEAEIRLIATRADATGQQLRFSYHDETRQAYLRLIGSFQAENVLMAAGLAIASGAAARVVFDTLEELQTVPGRMQLAATRKNGASVFVDYAHTPDAVETALKALRPHVMGRIIVVLGAGGDRDAGKRPLMGKAAAENADVVIVTDDNPRGEDPAAIRAAVLQGCSKANEISDRARAILAGVDALQPGDALLIAGKGHETGQVVGEDILPFNDIEQASVSVAALDGLGA
jgi:UDP-N-acetylmuramoyl-L-alanyl-D-glutamate--2,6-diaminopimelate ligase